MPRIEVDPGQLTAASGRQSAVAVSVMEAAGRLESAGLEAAGAAGEAGVSGAMASWTSAWASSLAALGNAVGGTAGNLSSAAGVYQTTDANAIPR
jgi:hypothetical protein